MTKILRKNIEKKIFRNPTFTAVKKELKIQKKSFEKIYLNWTNRFKDTLVQIIKSFLSF